MPGKRWRFAALQCRYFFQELIYLSLACFNLKGQFGIPGRPTREAYDSILVSLDSFEIGETGGRFQAGDIPILLISGVLPDNEPRQTLEIEG